MGQCNLLHALRLALTRIQFSAFIFCTCAEMRERYKRARRAPVYDRDERRPAFSQSPPDDASAQRGNRGGGSTGPGGGLGMSRLDAVVRVLKATGKALHYDIITRQALQQGIIRFTGSQGTAGESMKVSCRPSIYLSNWTLASFMSRASHGTNSKLRAAYATHRKMHRLRLHLCIYDEHF